MANILDTDIKLLPGVGERRAKILAKDAEIHTYSDLLYYFPYKHIDRTRVFKTTDINEHMPYIQLKGVITGFRVEGTGYKSRLIATFQDPYGVIELKWFNGVNYFLSHLKVNTPYLIFGKPVRFGLYYSISHPEVEPLKDATQPAGALYPVYSTSERMKKIGMDSRGVRRLVTTLFERLGRALPETLPDYIINHYGMLTHAEALRAIHNPSNAEELRRATLRLKTEEIFYIRLRMQYLLQLRKSEEDGFVLNRVGEGVHFLYNEALPFDLTNAQKRVIKEIREDMKSGSQMNRLLQGDVGSGKTIVALFTMLLAVDNGYQACLVAPTEILSQQHYQSLNQLLKGSGITVDLLTGSTKAKKRREIAEGLTTGALNILVSTHAVFEENVQFAGLGVAVIDEQHRFGVYQRSVMWEKSRGLPPHILIMSATPIPRTLAMTLYGDLDVSVLDELPPGRTPIQTRHLYENKRSEMNFFILDQIKQGRQVYVVYPLIEESAKIDIKSLEEGYAHLKECFPAQRIDMVHGRMNSSEKEEVMQRFSNGETDILVSTTVIEVGVNVPNATVMIIENAERFGLSQLHQLRGRVGRGSQQSYCILVTGDNLGKNSLARMGVMVNTTNGFVIAEEDLKLRGFGDMEGTRQSGEAMDLKIADLSHDERIVGFCAQLVDRILTDDPKLEQPKNALLKRHMDAILSKEKDWGLIS